MNRDYLENYIRKLLAEVLFDERRLEGVISEYNKMVNSNGSEYDSELKSVKSMIKKTKGEIDNLIGILAATGSASLAEAVSRARGTACRAQGKAPRDRIQASDHRNEP